MVCLLGGVTPATPYRDCQLEPPATSRQAFWRGLDNGVLFEAGAAHQTGQEEPIGATYFGHAHEPQRWFPSDGWPMALTTPVAIFPFRPCVHRR